MQFDPTIDVGNLLTMGALVLGGLGVYVRLEKLLVKLDSRITRLEDDYPYARQLDTRVSIIEAQLQLNPKRSH